MNQNGILLGRHSQWEAALQDNETCVAAHEMHAEYSNIILAATSVTFPHPAASSSLPVSSKCVQANYHTALMTLMLILNKNIAS